MSEDPNSAAPKDNDDGNGCGCMLAVIIILTVGVIIDRLSLLPFRAGPVALIISFGVITFFSLRSESRKRGLGGDSISSWPKPGPATEALAAQGLDWAPKDFEAQAGGEEREPSPPGRPETPQGALESLILLIIGLMIFYGFFAFVFPAVAGKVTPEAWEWPVKNPALTLILGDGRLAASTGEGVGRIQVYDASGRYLGGWFPPDNDGIGVTILGTGVDQGLAEAGPNTILVDYSRARKIILYDPEGRVLLEQDRPEYYRPSPQGRFVERSFKSPWYKWPLSHPVRGWLTIAAGGLGLALISFLKGRYRKGGEAGKKPSVPTALTNRPQNAASAASAARKKAAREGGRFGRLRDLRQYRHNPAENPHSGSRLKFWLVPAVAAVLVLAGLVYDKFGLPGTVAVRLLPLLIPLAWTLICGLSTFKTLRGSGSFNGRDPLLGKKLIILGIPVFLCLYGVFGFVLPGSAAPMIIPAHWQWPMTAKAQALVLPSGKRAARQLSAHRVQIYDADGRYLNGWYLDNGFTILGTGQVEGIPENTAAQDSGWGLETVEVQYSSRKILFDLQGNILRQEELPDYAPLPQTGRFVEMSFSCPWYLWPLANPLRLWVMSLIGLISMGVSQGLVRAMGRKEQ